MRQGIFIGIDLGTTGCKMILAREDGRIMDSAYVEYPILTMRPGWAEQEPDAWWRGIAAISQTLMSRNQSLTKDFLGIGICGQMHTQVYLDRNNQVLRNAITWMDQRSKTLVDGMAGDTRLQEEIYRHTANFISTTYSGPNILWVKQNEPEIYQKTAKILIAKDFIKYKLTGEMLTDYSDATGTLLLDVVAKRWSPQMFDLFGIRPELVPDVERSALVMARVSRQASLETGLPEGLPVINGSADQAATALGAGVIEPGQVSAIVGTAGVVSVCSDKPLPDPKRRTLCWNYCLEDKWLIVGIMQTAAESLHWFQNAFDKDEDNGADAAGRFSVYESEVAKITDGSEGLIFLPYLMGERTPYWDADARGVFYGISLNQHKYHFARAVMEGVGFGLKNNLETIESLGVSVRELRLLGGGSKSRIWREIIAKILGKKIITMKAQETGALGCSILCGLALGIYPNVNSAVELLVKADTELDYPELSPAYARNYQIFRELYGSLKGLYKKSVI